MKHPIRVLYFSLAHAKVCFSHRLMFFEHNFRIAATRNRFEWGWVTFKIGFQSFLTKVKWGQTCNLHNLGSAKAAL